MEEKEIVAVLYRNVYGTDKGKEIKEAFVDDITKIKSPLDAFKLYKKYETYATLGRALGTTKNIFADLRNIIKSQKSKYEEALLEAFCLPEGYYYAINDRSRKVVEDRKGSGVAVEFSLKSTEKLIEEIYVKGMDHTLSFWKKGLGSRQTKDGIRAYYLATFLALTTGRRLTEVLKTAEFSKYKNELRAKGILKKGEEALDEMHKLVPFADVTKIVKAWKELRSILDTTKLTAREVNNKYNAIFNQFLSKNIMEGKSFHDLRAIYGEGTWEKFCPREIGKREYIETVLLHARPTEQIRPVDFYLNRFKAVE